MKRDDHVIIKQEFDKSIRYLYSRGENLTVGECMQELGHIRLFIYNLGISEKNLNAYGQEILS